jgi:cyclopropane fatty-acyl-phospholipid synthase-like methyltransferase
LLYFVPMEKQWFESWFDTPYYHLLYKNRDDKEAQNFLDLILGQIPITPPDSILDLACGKGRHAIYLAKKGFDVTGMDLSPANILAASQSSHEHLQFEIKDMRDDLGTHRFDAVFNLFTGFGYFGTDEENFGVFENVKKSLKKDGYFLFDYLNADYVRALNTDSTEFVIEGIRFKTKKEFKDRWVIKHIHVTDGEKQYTYSERVALYLKHEIVHELENLGFEIIKKFGDYQLNAFKSNSPRLILVGHKR